MITKKRLTDFEIDIWEVIKVGGIIDGLDFHGDSGGSLSDVGPVDPLEPGQRLDVFKVTDPLVHLITEPVKIHQYIPKYVFLV